MNAIAETLLNGLLEAEHDLMAELLQYAHVLQFHDDDSDLISEVEDNIEDHRARHFRAAIQFHARAIQDGDRWCSKPLSLENRVLLDDLKAIVKHMEEGQ